MLAAILFDVALKDILPAPGVGIRNRNRGVEPAGTRKSGLDGVDVVGRENETDLLTRGGIAKVLQAVQHRRNDKPQKRHLRVLLAFSEEVVDLIENHRDT